MFFKTMAIIQVLCFLSILSAVNSQKREPSISYTSPEQEKDVGDTASLDCSVMNAESYEVIWQRLTPPSPITTNDKLQSVRLANKYDIKRREDKQASTITYSLQVKDIQAKDGGVYQCMIIDHVNPSTKEVSLQVRQPPVISDNSSKTVVAQEGQSVRLECLASGYPPPKISWKRENNSVPHTGGSTNNEQVFRFPSINRTDRGVYTCTADNGIGKKATRKMTVEVRFKPVITVPDLRVGQSLKYDIDLLCRVEAHPTPQITWYKDRTQLNSNEHYSISQITKALEYAGHTDTTIRILSIEKHQYGRYECVATNELGTATATVELFESKEPNLSFRGVLYNTAVRRSSCLSLLYSFLSSTFLLMLVSFP